MKFLVLAALAIPALAMPEPISGSDSLFNRDVAKLNQYRTLDDCKNDRNIISHAAPVSGRCYPLDDATGAFFYNTGGYLQSYAWSNLACGGTSYKLQRYTGTCVEKGDQESVKME